MARPTRQTTTENWCKSTRQRHAWRRWWRRRRKTRARRCAQRARPATGAAPRRLRCLIDSTSAAHSLLRVAAVQHRWQTTTNHSSMSAARAFGLGVGSAFVGGALGIGGGILAIPVLSKQSGFTQLNAQGTVSPLNTVTCLASSALFAYKQWYAPTSTTGASSQSVELHFDVIAAASTAALIASPLGVRLSARLADLTLRRMFAIGLTAMAPVTLAKQFYVERNQQQAQQQAQSNLNANVITASTSTSIPSSSSSSIPSQRPLSLTSAALAGASVGFLRFVVISKFTIFRFIFIHIAISIVRFLVVSLLSTVVCPALAPAF